MRRKMPVAAIDYIYSAQLCLQTGLYSLLEMHSAIYSVLIHHRQISWGMKFHGLPNWARFGSVFLLSFALPDFLLFSFSSQHFLTIFYIQMVLDLCSTKPAKHGPKFLSEKVIYS